MSLTDEQKQLRKKGIGASEIAAVCGLSPWQSALDVYAVKTGLSEGFEGNEFTEWGTRLEPVVAKKYEEVTGISITGSVGTLIHPKHEFALATPDYFSGTSKKPVQIKTARSAEGWGEIGDDMPIPEQYWAQVCWEMAVVNAETCDLAVWFRDTCEFRIYPVQRDAESEEMLIELGRRFWMDNVLRKIPPPASSPSDLSAYLKRRYPRNNGKMMKATPAMVEHIGSYRLMLEQQAVLDNSIEGLKCRIRQVIGEMDGLEWENGKITWKKSKDSESVDWKAVAQELCAIYHLDQQGLSSVMKSHTTIKPGARRFLKSGEFFKAVKTEKEK